MTTVELNRRQFLIVAAGIGVAAGTQRGAQPQPIIRTLLKDVAPGSMSPGAVLFHEHLSMHYPLTNVLAAKQGAAPPTHFYDDVRTMIEETKAPGREGVVRR